MVFGEGDAPPPAWVLTGSKLARAASGRPFVPASQMDGWDGFGVWTWCADCGVSNFLTVRLGGMLSDQAGDGWFISVPRWEL